MYSEASAERQKRIALVIGNAAYGHAQHLTNKVHDATPVKADFETVLLLGNLEFKRELREVFDAAHDSQAVIYYAGHEKTCPADGNSRWLG
jgi:uncharacterized caspase-like protein